MYIAIFSHYYMKTRHSKQVLVGLSVFSDGVLHFLQIKKKFYLFYQNYLVALNSMSTHWSFVMLPVFMKNIITWFEIHPLIIRKECDRVNFESENLCKHKVYFFLKTACLHAVGKFILISLKTTIHTYYVCSIFTLLHNCLYFEFEICAGFTWLNIFLPDSDKNMKSLIINCQNILSFHHKSLRWQIIFHSIWK